MTATSVDLRPTGGSRLVARELRAGALAMLPLVVGLVPLGLVVGAATGRVADPVAGWAGTWLLYGASVQLAVAEGLRDGAATVMIVLGALAVNARLVVYSATFAPHWRSEGLAFRLLAAAMVVDPSFALGRARYDRPGSAPERRSYYLGAAATLAIGWTVLVTTGMVLGDRIVRVPGADLALPLSLLALLAPKLRDRVELRVVIAAGLVTAASGGLPRGAALPLAIAAGALAGWTRRRAR
jgi:predicted branched-subunit amino acid permease